MSNSARPRTLALGEWPRLDQIAWDEACRPSERLRRGGRASHLKRVTRDDLARRYGLFLHFLARTTRLDRMAAAGIQVTPPNVEAFIAELRGHVSSVTLYGSICKLRRTTELIAPDHDLLWLRDIERDLAFIMKPRSKLGRVVLAQVLVEAGLTLMIEAEASKGRVLQRAITYRNGLMIALLACCPIRLKNFAALTLGKSLRNLDSHWWIVLRPEDTKEGRADERRVPHFLTRHLDRYHSHHRLNLTSCEKPPTSFWLSSQSGRSLSRAAIEKIVPETTALTTGVRVSPHLFRTSAATTAAIYSGATPHLGSALLDHRDSKTTQQHYNRASSLSAGKTYLEVVGAYLDS